MSVLITGSIAYDAVFSFAGAFGEQITRPVEPGFNTTFLTRAMRRDFGGCAGNIAVAMKRMGGEPLIWGAVGRDGGEVTVLLQGECSKCLILDRCLAWIEERIEHDLGEKVRVVGIRKKPYFQDK